MNDNEIENLKTDRIRSLILHTIKNNDFLEWEYELFFKLIWIIFHPKVNNHEKLSSHFLIFLNKEKEEKMTLFEKLDENYEEFKNYLISNRGIFSTVIFLS